MRSQIVITGLGIVSPIGCNEETYWQSLVSGSSGARMIARLAELQIPRNVACVVEGAVDGPDDTGRAARLAIAAARRAVSSAGLDSDSLDQCRTAIIVGTTMGETEFIEERLLDSAENWLNSEHLSRIARGRPGTLAKNVRDALNVQSSTTDLYGACAAGNLALTSAARRIQDGECDLALVGGADGFSLLAFLGFMRSRVMAQDRCRPFDEQREGLLVGEGAAFFVLETESLARARGARIRARIAGCGSACEVYHPTRPAPDGEGLLRAMQSALFSARMTPGDIQYVCAHGTGTPINDAVEVDVLQRLFPSGVAFSSIKSLTGHTMGAASALEAAACVLSMEHQTLLPTWNLEKPIEHGSLDAVRDAPRKSPIRSAMNNAAGFGGYNSCLILASP